MPMFLANTLLASGVWGPVVVLLALLASYGRVTFGLVRLWWICINLATFSVGDGYLMRMKYVLCTRVRRGTHRQRISAAPV